MTIRLELVNGSTEMFETDKYVVSSIKDLHPDILKAEVYSDFGKKIASIKRPHQKRYIKYEYKPLPEKEKK